MAAPRLLAVPQVIRVQCDSTLRHGRRSQSDLNGHVRYRFSSSGGGGGGRIEFSNISIATQFACDRTLDGRL